MLVRRKGQSPLIKNRPPLLYHETGRQRAIYRGQVEHAFRRYRESLRAQYRVLFDRFKYCDMAIKVVGVGSVGTFCAVALHGREQRSIVSPSQGSASLSA